MTTPFGNKPIGQEVLFTISPNVVDIPFDGLGITAYHPEDGRVIIVLSQSYYEPPERVTYNEAGDVINTVGEQRLVRETVARLHTSRRQIKSIQAAFSRFLEAVESTESTDAVPKSELN